MSKIHEVLHRHGKISNQQFEAIKAKEAKRIEAKGKSDTDLNKLSKTQLIAMVKELA